MRKGTSYESLEESIRIALQAALSFYEIDVTNSFFREILDRVVKDVKEGKQIYK